MMVAPVTPERSRSRNSSEEPPPIEFTLGKVPTQTRLMLSGRCPLSPAVPLQRHTPSPVFYPTLTASLDKIFCKPQRASDQAQHQGDGP